MTADVIIPSYKPWGTEMKGVMLGPTFLAIGAMQVGKTIAIESIVYGINKSHKVPQANLTARRFMDVFKIHEIPELVASLRGVRMINIKVDDTIKSMHSKKHNVESEQHWYGVRHYFEEEVGLSGVTINFFFAAQRYKTLSNALRQAPMMLFKPCIIRDDVEEMFYHIVVGKKNTAKLKRWAIGIYQHKNKKLFPKAILKIGDGKAIPYNIRETPGVRWTLIEPPVEEPNGQNNEQTRSSLLLDQLLQLHYGGLYVEGQMELADIAKAAGFAKSTIEKRLGKLGFRRYEKHKPPSVSA